MEQNSALTVMGAVDPARKQAEERLWQRLQMNAQDQGKAIHDALSMIIVDRMYYPHKMTFVAGSELRLTYAEEPDRSYRIHPHALGQIASVGVGSTRFVADLAHRRFTESPETWDLVLLADVLNTMFYRRAFRRPDGSAKKYLRRAVGIEIRGFQGASFKRHLATAPLLRAFIEACGEFDAVPVEARTSDVKTTLICMLPTVFEPVDGEFVAFGVTFSNSDFGAGTLSLSGTAMRISSGTTSVLANHLRKRHLGKVIDSDDGEILEISTGTIEKELETHKSAVQDVVRAVLSPASIDKALESIVSAHEQGIEWYRLRGSLSGVLTKAQMEVVEHLLKAGDDLMDLPPVGRTEQGTPMATKWWAANMLGWFAHQEDDHERKDRLQEKAGSLICGEND